jgi:hypothetical protein
MPNMIVVSPDPAGFALGRQCFEEAVVDRFKDQVKLIPEPPGFQIFHFHDGDMISTDGTTEQAVEVALWVRSLLPDDLGVRVWFVDQGYTGHAELVPGMTEGDIKTGWVEHDEFPPE